MNIKGRDGSSGRSSAFSRPTWRAIDSRPAFGNYARRHLARLHASFCTTPGNKDPRTNGRHAARGSLAFAQTHGVPGHTAETESALEK